MKIKGTYFMVLAASCGMIATSLGIITNIAGLFFSPIAAELGVGVGNVSMTLTISNLMLAAGSLMVPKLAKAKTFKPLLWCGALGMAGATAGLAVASNLAVLYILNAIRGFAAGLTSMVMVTMLINNWFRTNVGLITSIAMGSSGIAGAVLSPVFSAVIEAYGWRTGYLAAAVVMVILELPALLFPIAFRPEDVGMMSLGGQTEGTAAGTRVPSTKISTPLFIMAMIMAVSTSFATATPQHFPGIASAQGMAAVVGSGMLSVCMVTNTTGKLIFGVLSDKIGAKWSILLYGGMVCIAIGILSFIKAPGAMLVAAGLFGLSYSLATVGSVLFTKDTFGLEQYGNVFPKINMGTTVANAVGSSLIGFLYDASGTYISSLILVLVLLVIMMGIVTVVYGMKQTSHY